MTKEWNQSELNRIYKDNPELQKIPIVGLDEIVVEFLKLHDVNASPPKKKSSFKEGAKAAAIGAVAGLDFAGDAIIIEGQKDQTIKQEWTSWKQWALSHPDFLDYKQEILFRYEDRAYEIQELIKTPEMKEKIEECKKQFHKEKKEEKKLVFIALSLLLGIPLAVALVFSSIASIGNIINEFQNKSNPEKIK